MSNYYLQLMKLGPRDSYLCFVPPPLDQTSAGEEPEEQTVTPAHSWSLLQPLSGTCLYHRQGWFTYSYCHNEEIRQFKELIQARPPTPGGYKPEEDPEWEAYTLGRAPATPEPGADLTIAEQAALAANLELARTAGSRYLVQRWGDGTVCDKTGKPREVEVQFHCSMATTDTILFVKETKTCAYVLVIHTPRLCGEPGFISRKDVGEAYIRCREVVDKLNPDAASLSEADYPIQLPHIRKSVSPPPTVRPPPQTPQPKEGSTVSGNKGQQQKQGDFLRKALEAIMGNKELNLPEGQVIVDTMADDGVVIEFFDEIPLGDENVDVEHDATDGDGDEQESEQGVAGKGTDRLLKALKAAGFDVKLQALGASKAKLASKGDGEGNEKKKGKKDT